MSRETKRVPEPITVTDTMVEVVTEAIARIAETGPATWWARHENVKVILEAALAAREAE